MRLLSVNVGRSRTIIWRGREVRSAIWKDPIAGRRAVRRLNVDGDAQADLVAHGGEHRAVFVYQVESYRYWEARLGRSLRRMGQFGENFTVEAMADADVCIGDRYAIGSAVFEVTQPRVTCFKVGIRLDEPRMPALLTGHGRPGFYLRVIEEGEVGAGDEIVKVADGPQRLSVERMSALLYTPDLDSEALRRALRIGALSEGWRESFRRLLEQAESGRAGNSGLTELREPPAWSGFRAFRVAEAIRETEDVRSLILEPRDGAALPSHRAGQFVTLGVPDPGEGARVLTRSYSLSALGDGRRLRVSVKRDGRASSVLHDHVRPGDTIDVGAPRGAFTLDPDADSPVVLASAGIGVTPVLAMLAALARAGSPRPITWVHVARSGAQHALAAETRALLSALPAARSRLFFTRPGARDRPGVDFDLAGRPDRASLADLEPRGDSVAYLCGPPAFMDAMRDTLLALGLPSARIHTEAFGPGRPADARAPHLPADPPATGHEVVFARSSLTVRFDERWSSLLELAEACDVPVDGSCRTGVCHRCETGLVAGDVRYDPEPLDRPPAGSILLCCARPEGDVTVDA